MFKIKNTAQVVHCNQSMICLAVPTFFAGLLLRHFFNKILYMYIHDATTPICKNVNSEETRRSCSRTKATCVLGYFNFSKNVNLVTTNYHV